MIIGKSKTNQPVESSKEFDEMVEKKPQTYVVENITELTSDFVSNLKSGDIVVEKVSDEETTYIVSWKDNAGLTLTANWDVGTIFILYYLDEEEWTFDAKEEYNHQKTVLFKHTFKATLSGNEYTFQLITAQNDTISTFDKINVNKVVALYMGNEDGESGCSMLLPRKDGFNVYFDLVGSDGANAKVFSLVIPLATSTSNYNILPL